MTGETSCKDEARIGQKNGLVRPWARRGTRPRQPADQRYDNAYLSGAICPARSAGAASALPCADTDMMQLHLDEISRNVAAGADDDVIESLAIHPKGRPLNPIASVRICLSAR